jgi:hypothetical protein
VKKKEERRKKKIWSFLGTVKKLREDVLGRKKRKRDREL